MELYELQRRIIKKDLGLTLSVPRLAVAFQGVVKVVKEHNSVPGILLKAGNCACM